MVGSDLHNIPHDRPADEAIEGCGAIYLVGESMDRLAIEPTPTNMLDGGS